MKKTLYSLYLKRFIDIALSLFSLVVLSPFLLGVIILQIFFNGFPIFFLQFRVGKDEKFFKIIKFRTMNEKKDRFSDFLPDNKRITWFGSILRLTSIDELPSLINVLKGDMAVIGPRPLLVEYLQLYNLDQKQRHLVRPGLSGLAQIKGRNKLSWNEKLYFDLVYLKSISFFLDLKIIFITIIKVFLLSSINKDKNTTSSKFNGKN